MRDCRVGNLHLRSIDSFRSCTIELKEMGDFSVHRHSRGCSTCFGNDKTWVQTRDAPITYWLIIGRPIIGAKQSADRLIQKVPETGQKPAVHTV